MRVTLTIKIAPETQEDYDTLGEQVSVIRGHFESLKQNSVLGPPEQVELRYWISNESKQSLEPPTCQPNIQEEINDPATT